MAELYNEAQCLRRLDTSGAFGSRRSSLGSFLFNSSRPSSPSSLRTLLIWTDGLASDLRTNVLVNDVSGNGGLSEVELYKGTKRVRLVGSDLLVGEKSVVAVDDIDVVELGKIVDFLVVVVVVVEGTLVVVVVGR